jgi:hypothetical protein
MVSRGEFVRDATQSGLPRLVAAVAVLLPLTTLIQVLAELRDYRYPAVPVAVWLGMIAIAVVLVPRTRIHGFSGAQAVGAVAIAVAAVALTGWARRAHFAPGSVDLSVLGAAWLLVLVELSRVTWAWVGGALLVLAVHAAFVVGDMGMDPVSMSQLVAAGYAIVIALAGFAALLPTLATHAGIAARRAALASESAAERAAADAIMADRHERLALMELEALPLLRGIAAGALDPADDGVRERCARHAATLRHSLTGQARGAEDLLPGLDQVLRAASARGVLVDVGVIGEVGPQPPQVAAPACAAVDALISTLPPYPVTLTILDSGDEVELYLIFSQPPRAIPEVARFGRKVPAAAGWRAMVNIDETGTGSLEVCWRKAGGA